MDALYKGIGDPPPTSGPTPPKNKTAWWISCGEQIPACSVPTTYAKQAAAQLGWTLKIADARLGANGGFLTAMRQAIAAKPDVIIEEALDCVVIEQPLKEAKAAGIPVIGADANDCNSPDAGNGGAPLFAGPMKFSKAAPLASDFNKLTGTVGADYIINKTSGHAKIIDATLEYPLIKTIDGAFRAELKKCAGCQIVGTFSAGVADVTAGGPFGQALQAALVKHPDADVIYMPLDSELQSGGGVKIVKQAGRKIMVVGGQAVDPAVVAYTKSGDISAMTSVNSAEWLAYGAFDTAVRVLAKVPTVNEGNTVRVVDATHAVNADNSVETAAYDIKAAYTKLWKVAG